jgi:hypothetical protein
VPEQGNRLFAIQPRIAGRGPTLFAGLSKYVDLKLVSRLEFASGAVAMRYKLAAYDYQVAGYLIKSNLGPGYERLTELVQAYYQVVEFPAAR